MTLTGLPLLVTSAALTVALAVVTGLLWWRTGRHGIGARLAVRPVALLLTEALAVLTVAIAANRELDIYPSWSVLFGKVHTVEKAVAAPPAGLEEWLHGQAREGGQNGLAFAWKPAGGESWHLPAAPTVAVPPAYFHDSAARFPVVLVVASRKAGVATSGWDDRHALQSVPAGGSAVVVLVRVDDPAAARPVLTTALPAQLERDLRVQPANWCAVGVGPDLPLALDLLQHHSDRYGSAALVTDGEHGPPGPVIQRLKAVPVGLDLVAVAAAPVDGASTAVAKPAGRLAAALRWAYQHTPAPLAAPLVDPALPPGGTP